MIKLFFLNLSLPIPANEAVFLLVKSRAIRTAVAFFSSCLQQETSRMCRATQARQGKLRKWKCLELNCFPVGIYLPILATSNTGPQDCHFCSLKIELSQKPGAVFNPFSLETLPNKDLTFFWVHHAYSPCSIKLNRPSVPFKLSILLHKLVIFKSTSMAHINMGSYK
jgi:hypothetical protein